MTTGTRTADWADTLAPPWLRSEHRTSKLTEPHGRVAIAAAQIKAGERVVDVGCGTGGSTVELGRPWAPRVM